MRIAMEFDGESYRHIRYISKVECTSIGASTLFDILSRQARISPESQLYGTINDGVLLWKTYRDVISDICKIYAHLRSIVKPREIIGICSVNRMEWMYAEHTIHALGCISSPIYSTFGIESSKHIFTQTGMRVCFMSGREAKLIYNNIVKNRETCLDIVVAFEDFELKGEYEKMGINVYLLPHILSVDASEAFVGETLTEIERTRIVNAQDIATICYTSGTMGVPKGAMLTHNNFIVNIVGLDRNAKDSEFFTIDRNDTYVSYLPLPHIMERLCVYALISKGAKIGFYGGNTKRLIEDFRIIRPTFLAGVPRVYNSFVSQIEEGVAKMNFVRRTLFKMALYWKSFLRQSGCYKSIIDPIFFNKIRESFGGRVEKCLSGGAPLSQDVMDYLRACLCCHVFQGYGQTETTGVSMLTPLSVLRADTVGIAYPSNLVKLDNLPDGRLEILVSGDNVFKGYYKNERATKDCFKNGWFRTGDIGAVGGSLFRVVGRRKDMFKIGLGEYIVPEKLELIYSVDKIDDILIVGMPSKNYIIAIIVCTDENVSKEVLIEKVKEAGKDAFLRGEIPKYEIPKKFIIRRKPFSHLGDVVTPTGKKRRYLIEKILEKDIADLYKDPREYH